MRVDLSTLAACLPQARLQGQASIESVSTDTRQIIPGSLFVALRGERFDGHDFLAATVEQGTAAVLAEALPPGFELPALVVPDSRQALGEIAGWWRQQHALPVIAVTGSNGKTTVKEMIAAILRGAFGEGGMLATQGNLNNDIGVPLTLLRLQAHQRAAVVELGMNHPGEIAALARMVAPDVALVNNAQREHLEFMHNVEAVAYENGAVLAALSGTGTAVFPHDDAFTALWRGLANEAGRVLTFGLDPGADISASWEATASGNRLQVSLEGRSSALQLAAAGEHNVRNALAAIACTHAIGVPMDLIVCGLEAFLPVAGRLQHKQAGCGAAVIDDTYNANPDSVRAAIAVLAQRPGPRLLVLGDMGEVGNQGPQFHAEIGAYARTAGIEHLYTLGALAQHASLVFGPAARHCDSLDTLQHAVTAAVTPLSTVLVKGSRFMQMERVVQHLTHPHSKETD